MKLVIATRNQGNAFFFCDSGKRDNFIIRTRLNNSDGHLAETVDIHRVKFAIRRIRQYIFRAQSL